VESVLRCPQCNSENIGDGGSDSGKPRWRCRDCGRKWLKEYQSKAIKETINTTELNTNKDNFQFEERENKAVAEGSFFSKHRDQKSALEEFLKELDFDESKWKLVKIRAGKSRVSSLYRDQNLEWKGSVDKEGKQIMSGHAIRKPEWHGVWNWSFRAEFVPKETKEENNLRNLTKTLIDEIKNYKPQVLQLDTKVVSDGDLLIVFLNDLHLGRLSWAEEVGKNYDHKIAQQNFREGLNQIIAQSSPYQIKRILFVINGDLFNYDYWGKAGPLTANGTPQSSDERWQKLYRVGYRLVRDAGITCANIAPTTIIPVEGNHDKQTMFYLGEHLFLAFEGQKHVDVDNSIAPRKYFSFGNSVFGFAHGQKEKPNLVHNLMFSDYGTEMGKSDFQYYYLAHKHHEVLHEKELRPKQRLLDEETHTSEDYRGMFIHYLPNLAYRDHYEYYEGYIGTIRSMLGAIHDPVCGRKAVFNYNKI
jgi:DNA-directed RNA polymerase subunit RPC12/RpoP